MKFLLTPLLLIPLFLAAQQASFTAPDTVYAGEPVHITNTSTGGTTWYWSFCSDDLATLPVGTNIGNPANLLSIPAYTETVNYANESYAFVSSQGNQAIVRIRFGKSFGNSPQAAMILASPEMFGDTILGIRIGNDNGRWVGYVCNNNRLVRMDFGNSPANLPVYTVIGGGGMLNTAHCIDLFREGGNWTGFITCSWGQRLVRADFGSSLLNAPVYTDLGVPGGLDRPGSFRFVSSGGNWYAFVVNMGNNTISRLFFGNSLFNTPTGVNLGVVCPGVDPGGIMIRMNCGEPEGFLLDYRAGAASPLWRISFPGGLTGPLTGTPAGNIGDMNRPTHFSHPVREGDSLIFFNANRGDGSLTRLMSLPCPAASVHSSTAFTPPVFSYDTPGTYRIRLIMNEGMADEASACRTVVVLAGQPASHAAFDVPDTVCTGETLAAVNLSEGGTKWLWRFCGPPPANTLTGHNAGSPGATLTIPGDITLVRDGNDCYSFVTQHSGATVTRFYHGTSFMNDPVSWTDLGNFGILGDSVQGIRVRYDNGEWIGIVADNKRLLRLRFGNSPGNFPTAELVGPNPLLYAAHGLEVVNENGRWIGLMASNWGDRLVRLEFGNTLLNDPVVVDLGHPGMNMPASFSLLKQEGEWYAVAVNYGDNTWTRLRFGNSLANVPTGVNLGVLCPNTIPTGIALLPGCGSVSGLQLNTDLNSANPLWQLDFAGGITGPATGAPLGNIGTLSQPLRLSEFVREGDTMVVWATNRGNHSLTRLMQVTCPGSAIPSSTQFNPPPWSYPTAGSYPVRLTMNEGMFDQEEVCHTVTVLPRPDTAHIDTLLCNGARWFAGGAWQTAPGTWYDTVPAGHCDSIVETVLNFKPAIPVNLGPDSVLCGASTVVLYARSPGSACTWQDGSTDTLFVATGPGTYWVKAARDGCSAADTVRLFECKTPLWFPDSFTPNGDGINDTFHPVGFGVETFHMVIFDRWGRQVFETDRMSPGWDGKINGVACSEGVYVFLADYTMADEGGVMYHARGSVTVLD